LTQQPGPAITEALLRQALSLARTSREHGNHPFGALLASADGRVLVEAENTVVTDRDCTGHAEMNLIRRACQSVDSDAIATATLYTSTEPCAMCAGAIYWAGVSRVVFALGEDALRAMTGADPNNPTLALPSREVFARGQRAIEVIGPLLDVEAREVHDGFWEPPLRPDRGREA